MRPCLKSVARFAGSALVVALVLVGHAPPTLAGKAEVEAGIDAIKRKDFEAAYKILRPEAEAGNARAQFAIGNMYFAGLFVAQDDKVALEWYHRAAAQDYKPAFYWIGVFYLDGTGVERDTDKGYSYLVRAGDYPQALLALGLIHMPEPQWRGQQPYDGYRDLKPEKSARYFLRAARVGVRDAFRPLFHAYCQGAGVPKDTDEAYTWLALGFLTIEFSTKDEMKYFIESPRTWSAFPCMQDGAATPEQQAVAIAAARAMLKTLPKEPSFWD